MRFIAEELREYMAKLGVRTVDELVGRSDFLRMKKEFDGIKASKSGPVWDTEQSVCKGGG